jgi:hypothetical protein
MAVETLLNRGLNVRDFHPVEEVKSEGLKQKFTGLKSKFCDKESGLWKSYLGAPLEIEHYPEDQLIGLLVENVFDKKDTRAKYETLKEAYFNSEDGMWQSGTGYRSMEQLLVILAKEKFDKKAAQEHYEHLKNTPLYNAKTKTWNYSFNNPTPPIDLHFVGILAEGMFDKKNAEQLFTKLKKTSPLYDKEKNEWRNHVNIYLNDSRFAKEQLLGILVEGIFDPFKASKHYEDLKKTAFYDSKQGYWNRCIQKGQKGEWSIPTSRDQLLGILVEAMLEEEKPKFVEKIEPIPQTRRF